MAEHQYVAIRALSRGVNIRVKNSAGSWTNLSHEKDTVIDLMDANNRRELSKHGAIGQFIVTATNNTYHDTTTTTATLNTNADT